MGRSEKEGSPIQPDGSLLSLVGDLLFAGAILIMIYPCIRKTVSRLDGQFFRQFFHIVEILLAVAVLSFVLMLLIGQQMRIAYCSFIRPYMGESDEDKAYIGVLLKFLVCLLLLLNYFCASGLQKLVGFITDRIQQPVPVPQERLSRHATPHLHFAQYGDALTNNSNTNSQTPVTQTQSVMQSDILSYMSFPQLSPEPYPEPSASRQGHHSQYRDVGTMVRFPVAEYQHCNQCTLHFCPAQCPRPSTAPPTVLYSSLPSTTISNMPHSPFVETRTSQSMSPGEASSHHMPARIPNQTGRGPEVFYADSSCHFVLNPPSQMSFGPPGACNSIYSSASRTANRYNACMSERRGQGGGGMESDPPSSCYSSDYTSSGSSSRESNQSSFLSSLGLTSVPRNTCDQGSRVAASVENACHTDPGSASRHTPSSNAARLVTPGLQNSPESTSAQSGGRSSPVSAQSGFCLSDSSTLAVNSPVFGGPASCSVSNASPVTNLSGALAPTYVHSTSPPVCCLQSPKPHCSPQQFHHVCSPTPPPSAYRTSTASTRPVRRRQLPPMPKMTRSGKIYGYG